MEAVPDETGDTSHIIRFTFRKPNSLFIEHTPTFMFYRLLHGCKHYKAPMRPEGLKVLATLDIFDWEGLFRTISQQGQAAGPSPGKQVWDGLSGSLRKKIQSNPPRDSSNDAYKQELVDGLNASITRRGFYDEAAFKTIRARTLSAGSRPTRATPSSSAMSWFNWSFAICWSFRTFFSESGETARPPSATRIASR